MAISELITQIWPTTPAISERQQATIFAPFTRLQPCRERDTGKNTQLAITTRNITRHLLTLGSDAMPYPYLTRNGHVHKPVFVGGVEVWQRFGIELRERRRDEKWAQTADGAADVRKSKHTAVVVVVWRERGEATATPGGARPPDHRAEVGERK